MRPNSERRGEEEDREEKSWKERRGLESGIAFLRSISIRFSRVALLEIVTCRGELNNKTWGIFSSVTLSSNRIHNPLTFQPDVPINFAVPPNPFNDR